MFCATEGTIKYFFDNFSISLDSLFYEDYIIFMSDPCTTQVIKSAFGAYLLLPYRFYTVVA